MNLRTTISGRVDIELKTAKRLNIQYKQDR